MTDHTAPAGELSGAPGADVELLRSWVDGAWAEPAGHRFDVRNPATGALLARVAGAGTADLDHAVAAARRAFETHRRVTAAERGGWCRAAADVLRERADTLAVELSQEHGKPLTEARGEVAAAIDGLEVAAREALTDCGTIPQVKDPNKRILVRREPRGVWAVLTPTNFPLNIPVEYLGPALASGNAVVWKPAPTTSRIAVRLLGALHDAGVPEGLVQLVLSDDVDLARALVTHRDVGSVGFTGGTAAGTDIARRAWDKHLLLELGGNGPAVVLDDAPMSLTAPAVASAAFWNAGQVCSAAGRIIATRAVAPRLAETLAAEAARWTLGDPLDAGTRIGPLHTAAGAARALAHVEDATRRGAALLTGGTRPPDAATQHFVSPAVLVDVPTTALGFTEETFGPVAAITVVDDDEAALALANDSAFGLVGSLFTASIERALHLAERIDCGMVVVNDTSNYWEHNLPFGGAAGRASGRGRLGGRSALDEFTQSRVICLDLRR